MMEGISHDLLQLIVVFVVTFPKSGNYRLISRGWKSAFDRCVTRLSLKKKDDSNGRFLAEVVDKNTPNVTELIMRHDCNIDLAPLSRVLSQKLTSLKVYGGHWGIHNFSGFPEALSHLTYLKSLDLHACSMEKTHFDLLVPSLTGLKLLQTLDLGRNYMGHLAAVTLSPYFAALTSLTKLVLSENLTSDHGDDQQREAIASFLRPLKSLTLLRHLDLSFNGFGNTESIHLELANLLCPMTRLRELLIGSNSLGFPGLMALAPSLEGLAELRVLGFGSNAVTIGSRWRNLSFSFLAKMTDLISLDLSCNSMIGQDFADVAASLPGSVENLDLSRNHLPASAVRTLFPSFRNIRGLNLDATCLVAESLVPFAPACLAGLHTLSIASTNLETDSGALSSIFRHLKELRELDLGHTQIGRILASLAPSLGGMTALRSLKLASNGIGIYDGATSLAMALEKLTGLRTLCLPFNGLKSADMRTLMTSLTNMAYLETLDLNSNYICSAGVEALVHHFEKTESLRDMDLSHNFNSKSHRKLTRD